jgi:hypothetical protein
MGISSKGNGFSIETRLSPSENTPFGADHSHSPCLQTAIRPKVRPTNRKSATNFIGEFMLLTAAFRFWLTRNHTIRVAGVSGFHRLSESSRKGCFSKTSHSPGLRLKCVRNCCGLNRAPFSEAS